ncbi:MAG: hypothetical protein P4L39_06720 [Humidesulfovibrio sp.]|nr:hypothetical protein [Humidesulfovibrio sp.]
MAEISVLQLRAAPETLAGLTPLAREGFGVLARPGRTLRETLTKDLGLCPECVEERIQTVFLDGSPVDDIDQDRAQPGCTLALAAAMPGVAGIAMRRGSPVGVFRESVTHHADARALDRAEPFELTLKLFNSVAVECLANVLVHGVVVRAARLAELLETNPEALAEASFTLDGQPLDRAAAVRALHNLPGTLRLEALL